VAGIPGLILAYLCLLLRDPPRGIQEEVSATGAAPSTGAERIGAPPKSTPTAAAKATWLTYGRLLRYRAYALTVLGYAAYTFAVGGLAFWMPTFLERSRGMTRSEATVSFGTIVVITGFVGTFLGGWMGDYFAKRSQRAYLWLSAFSCLIAAPLVWVALTTRSQPLYLSSMVAAQLCLFLSTGPINAAIVNLVTATERASAIALSVFAIHLLGDVLSPPLIGALSDRTSLESAVKIVPVAVVVGGVIWLWAASTVPRIELKQTTSAARR
jgi:MFS transporter, Spinster family, sphingosine-1-phosphate transporter